MNNQQKKALLDFLRMVVVNSEKFITKVETGKARSKETYNDMRNMRVGATTLLYMVEDLK